MPVRYPKCRGRSGSFRGKLSALFGIAIAGLMTLNLLVQPRDMIADEKTAADGKQNTPKPAVAEELEEPIAYRPKVPGLLKLRLRSRAETEPGSGRYESTVREQEWKVSETAIIICDMWDDLYCKCAVQRINVMAPRMNDVITAARNHGVMIVHAPSGTMDVYADTPYRRRMQQARHAEPPVPLKGWCYLEPEREPEMPVDTSKQPCDDPVVGKRVPVYTKQNPALKIIGYDGISDRGDEIYNVFRQEGIKNVVLMGVHTNMCVLGRPFGIRQMVHLGFNVALARDLTDAMYDPREYPYVSHTRGTELVIEHIEQYWCPSILGEDLTRVIPGSADPDPAVIEQRAKTVAASKN